MFFKSWFTNTKSVKTEISIAVDNLLSMELSNISLVYSSDSSFIQVNTYCNTIVDYIALLTKAISSLKFDTVIYPIQIPSAMLQIYVRDFYLDKDKNFVEPLSMTKEFINLSIEFLQLYEQSEQRSDKSFTTEKNLLLTQNLISNIISISLTLQEITYYERAEGL